MYRLGSRVAGAGVGVAGDEDLHGWHPDPYARFEERYFINGEPSHLVRTDGVEASDPHQIVATAMDVPATFGRRARRANGFAVASLVLGLMTAGVGSILALIFGYHARRQIRASAGEQSGNGMAVTGIVLGWLGLIGTVILVVVLVGHVQSSARTARRQTAAQCEAAVAAVTADIGGYFFTHDEYPASLQDLYASSDGADITSEQQAIISGLGGDSAWTAPSSFDGNYSKVYDDVAASFNPPLRCPST